MISYLEGKVISTQEDRISVLLSSGIGYEVNVDKEVALSHKKNDDISLHTHLRVTDDALELYGFENPQKKTFFSVLTSVSGVGPSSAMRVLSLGSIADIKSAIKREDKDYLTAVKGIGKKTAGRMIVELQEKVEVNEQEITTQQGEKASEVIEALTSMGYSRQEARAGLEGVETEDKTVQDILKKVLQNLK
ncbi:MAG: Holliday junction branch migration protein RuvA [Candidatus Paceibacteria bacterium]